MNPFDLTGPAFLGFYVVLGLATLALLEIARRSSEAGETTPVTLSDPYLIAYLRGGRNEALRVATVSLVDRGLLSADDDTLKAPDPAAAGLLRRPLEKALLAKFRERGSAREIFEDPGLAEAAELLRPDLERAGLVPDEALRRARNGLAAFAIGWLAIVAGVKVLLALSRGRHNVAFLVVLAVVFVVVAWKIVHRDRTPRGDRLLSDLRSLFSGLKDRAETLHAGGATAEAALLAAVFGIAALPTDAYGYARKLYPRAADTSSSSSSCGSSSSCSSGSSCGSSCGGGGGCGGCGS